VVLAGGAWSSLFLAAHGLRLPQLSVRATVAATEPLPDIFPGNATDQRFAFRRRADGGYTLAPGDFHEFLIGPDSFRHFGQWVWTWAEDPWSTRLVPAAPGGYPDGWTTPRRWDADRISPFERHRTLDPRPHRGRVERIRADFQRAFPQLPPVRIRAAWAGMIDSLPDIVPVIDPVAQIPGLIAATGMSGHGFGIGPGMGRVIADLVTGRAVGHDLSRFRLSRFTDGSPIRPGPSL
jgi:glycine/D-amino acid oxidase-like deaminating enzyme